MKSKKNDLQRKVCYICGKEGANSKDHVPPKGIFLKEIRSVGDDLLTVPAHAKCNSGCSKDDKYFQFFLSIPGYWQNENARQLWKDKIYPGIQKKEDALFKKQILSNMKPIKLRSETGIDLGDTATINLDAKRINGVIERIVRGIYYHTTGFIMPLQNTVRVELLTLGAGESLGGLNSLKHTKSFGEGTFQYKWDVTLESRTTAFFWLSFFNALEFAAFALDLNEYEAWQNKKHMEE